MSPSSIEKLLKNAKTIAVVGLSGSRWRPSYGVSEYMQSVGYRIIPVNPNETRSAGRESIRHAGRGAGTGGYCEFFRQPQFVPEIVDAAIRIGAKCVWMQEGVVHEEAAAKAREAGLEVVMDRCILKEHRKLRV